MTARVRPKRPSAQSIAFSAVAFCAMVIGSAHAAAHAGAHVADRVRAPLVFPRDHGVHRREGAEWWLLTGHLHTRDGRRFAYHAAFFRFALGAREELYAANVSVLDERSGATVSAVRTVRARMNPRSTGGGVLALTIGGWRLAGRPLRDPRLEELTLRAGEGGNDVALSVHPQKPPSPSPAFDGYAFTRMHAHGSVTFSGRRYAVDGLTWLDHEYERHAQTPARVGWERFELQFNDGRDVELFAARLRNGRFGIPVQPSGEIQASSEQLPDGPDVPVAGMVVERDGAVRALSMHAQTLTIEGDTNWHSPHTGATYPALWRLAVPLMRLDNAVAIAPVARDQEVVPAFGGVPIWYGAVDLTQAELPGLPLGVGYVLLTGYAVPTSL